MGGPEPVSGWAKAHSLWPKTREVLLAHSESWLGHDAFAEAANDFPFDTDAEIVEGEAPAWAELFLSWQLYDWIPGGKEMTIAAHWLAKASATGEIFRMIQSANQHALSFYQVQAIDPGRGAVLRNLLSDEELFVVDRSLSEMVPPWTVLFARLVEFGGITFFDGVGHRPLPPAIANDITAVVAETLRIDVPLPLAELRRYGSDLVSIYDEAIYQFDEQRTVRPVLHTTDGELLVPCKDTWRIQHGKRQAVLKQLEALGFEVETENARTIFRWVRVNAPGTPLPTTLLGTITVEAAEFHAETHSRERQKRLRADIEQALGALATDLASEERDQEEIFSGDDNGERGASAVPSELEQEMLQAFLTRHYATWPDTALPALGGKSPRKAMKTPKGRSQVEMLLRDMEFRTHGSPMEDTYDFNELRKALGLPAAG